MAILIRIVVIAVSLWLATLLVPGIELGPDTTAARVATLLGVALIFGVVNVLLKPIVVIFSCPLYILTLGLFGLVVNALLFMFVGWLAGLLHLPFIVEGFWPAFWGAIVVAIVSFLLHLFIPDRLDQR